MAEMLFSNITMLLYMQITPFIIGIIYPVITIIAGLLGIKKYRLTGNLANKFEKLVCFSTGLNESSRPEGMIFGKWFVGQIHVGSNGRIAWYYGTSYVINKLKETLDDEKAPVPKKKAITLHTREGSFGWFEYTEINFYPPSIVANGRQKALLEKICALYSSPDIGGEKKKEYCTTLISGPPGVGKSSIPILLAKQLLDEGKQVRLIDSFNPTDPGDSFDKLYNRIEPTEKKPLIVVLEEVDTIVRKLNEGIERDKKSPILIMNKTGWNSFFDTFGKNRYRHTYFIMTSNKSLEWFNGEDPSYFRKGRVDECIEF
jgi:hypothetical protein